MRALVAMALVGQLFAWPALARAADTDAASDRRPGISPGPGYVSSGACGSCHPGQHETWSASYHRTMTQLPDAGSIVGNFGGQTLSWLGRHAKLGRTGDEFWVELRDEATPAAGAPERKPIVLLTGSHNIQMYWTSAGRSRLIERLPFVYHIHEQRWLPIESAFIFPPGTRHPTSSWNDNCIACHSTNGRPHLPPGDTEVSELGIACEACHGPGLRHVERHANPAVRYREHLRDAPDDSIVHPGRLDHRLSSQTCGQCHGVRYDGPSETAGFLRRGYTYRPGDDLEQTALLVRYPPDAAAIRKLQERDPQLAGVPVGRLARRVAEEYPRDGLYWPDGVARTAGTEYTAMLESACFERGTMTCMSCHSMHKAPDDTRTLREWANDQLGPGMEGDAACLQCHPQFRERPEQHTRHSPGSAGSRCQNCHMPFTSYALLKGVRSHTVRSPRVQESTEAGRPNACNQCHLDRTLTWAATHLEAWYGTPAPVIEGEEAEVAAGVLWLLRGDAGQRALVAWSMGWEDAQAASGTGWMAPLLAQLLDDPYPAVRFIAGGSLRDLPEMESLRYDPMSPQKSRHKARDRAVRRWEQKRASDGAAGARATVLLDDAGSVRWDAVQDLLKRRDDRPIFLRE